MCTISELKICMKIYKNGSIVDLYQLTEFTPLVVRLQTWEFNNVAGLEFGYKFTVWW